MSRKLEDWVIFERHWYWRVGDPTVRRAGHDLQGSSLTDNMARVQSSNLNTLRCSSLLVRSFEPGRYGISPLQVRCVAPELVKPLLQYS